MMRKAASGAACPQGVAFQVGGRLPGDFFCRRPVGQDGGACLCAFERKLKPLKGRRVALKAGSGGGLPRFVDCTLTLGSWDWKQLLLCELGCLL